MYFYVFEILSQYYIYNPYAVFEQVPSYEYKIFFFSLSITRGGVSSLNEKWNSVRRSYWILKSTRFTDKTIIVDL